jgi:opacity protein-like surface antigen
MLRVLLAIVVLALLTAINEPEWAELADFEFTPMIGYAVGGAFRDAASGAFFEIGENRNFGFAFDIKQDDLSQVEVYYNRQRTQLRTGGGLFVGSPLFDLDIQYFHLGGTYGAGEGNVKPFAVGTLGVTRMTPKAKNLVAETKPSLSLGGGVKLMATDSVGVRLEGRWFGTFLDGSGSIFCANGSCELSASGNVISQYIVNAGLIVAF